MLHTTGLEEADDFYNFLEHYKRALLKEGWAGDWDESLKKFEWRLRSNLRRFTSCFSRKYFGFSNPKVAFQFLTNVKYPLNSFSSQNFSKDKNDISGYLSRHHVSENDLYDVVLSDSSFRLLITHSGVKINEHYRNEKLGEANYQIARKMRRYLYSYLLNLYLDQLADFFMQFEQNLLLNFNDDKNNKIADTKAILKYFFNGRKPINKKDYQKLEQYTCYMIEHGRLKKDMKPIDRIELPDYHIIYIFYLLHKKIFASHTRQYYFFDFLIAVFKQLEDWRFETNNLKNSPLYKKFSTKPKTFESDFPDYKEVI